LVEPLEDAHHPLGHGGDRLDFLLGQLKVDSCGKVADPIR